MDLIYSLFFSYFEGLRLGMYTLMLSTLLDNTLCQNETNELIKEKPELYFQGLQANYINLLGLAPIYYIIVYNYFLDLNKLQGDITTNIIDFSTDYLALVLLHNIGYYGMHVIMHKIHELKFIHDFHHLYKNTIPSTGNAVSIYEFNFAYVLPFVGGAYLIHPSSQAMNASIMTISLLNIFIHTPAFKNIDYPKWLVSPGDHMKHHETYSNTYAAPLLNIDYFVNNNKSDKQE